MILEITKKQLSNRTVRLGSEEYKIDNQGKFEVSAEKGKAFAEKYDWIFPEGKLPITDEKGKTLDPADEETVLQLQADVNRYKSEVESKKKDIELLKGEVKVWRDKCQELIDGKNVEMPAPEPEVTTEPVEGEVSLEAELKEKSFEDLKVIYKETGGNLQGIKSKEQVIKKLVELDDKE